MMNFNIRLSISSIKIQVRFIALNFLVFHQKLPRSSGFEIIVNHFVIRPFAMMMKNLEELYRSKSCL